MGELGKSDDLDVCLRKILDITELGSRHLERLPVL